MLHCHWTRSHCAVLCCTALHGTAMRCAVLYRPVCWAQLYYAVLCLQAALCCAGWDASQHLMLLSDRCYWAALSFLVAVFRAAAATSAPECTTAPRVPCKPNECCAVLCHVMHCSATPQCAVQYHTMLCHVILLTPAMYTDQCSHCVSACHSKPASTSFLLKHSS